VNRLVSARILACLALCAFFGGCANAADFGFSVIIRAGTSSLGDWEIGVGPRGGSPADTSTIWPYYGNNGTNHFEIGYTQSTNTAYVRMYTLFNLLTFSATYNPVGGAALGANGAWTLPASSFLVSAAPNSSVTTGVTVSNLTFSSGLNVLQGLSSTSLTVSQSGAGATRTEASPVVFRATNNGGDWMLSGDISFAGLSAYYTNGAQASQLQFDLTASASDVPETSSGLMLGTGMALIAVAAFRKRKG